MYFVLYIHKYSYNCQTFLSTENEYNELFRSSSDVFQVRIFEGECLYIVINICSRWKSTTKQSLKGIQLFVNPTSTKLPKGLA
jgi:hypothetical protein